VASSLEREVAVDKSERGEREKHKRVEHEHEGGEHKRGEHDRERAHGTGYGREQAVYREFLARRWQGSEPPTPQSYALALKQLRQLPGSVVTTPTDLGTLPPSHASQNQNQPNQKPATGNKRRES
jgi:hypothetical protein